jgi:small redox-active disulfide protein 2
MKIQVLGSGCPTCKALYELTKRAVAELGIKEKVEYSTDVLKIIEMGVMQSPVLAIDGKPAMVGSGDLDKIKGIISKGNNANKAKVVKVKSKCSCGNSCC